jgi:hypothetical protein
VCWLAKPQQLTSFEHCYRYQTRTTTQRHQIAPEAEVHPDNAKKRPQASASRFMLPMAPCGRLLLMGLATNYIALKQPLIAQNKTLSRQLKCAALL